MVSSAHAMPSARAPLIPLGKKGSKNNTHTHAGMHAVHAHTCAHTHTTLAYHFLLHMSLNYIRTVTQHVEPAP